MTRTRRRRRPPALSLDAFGRLTHRLLLLFAGAATPPSAITSVTTDASATPTTTHVTLGAGRNGVRVWTGEPAADEGAFDLYVRRNGAAAVKVRLYRLEGKVLYGAAGDTFAFGTLNGRALRVSQVTAPLTLVSPSAVSGTANCDRAGPSGPTDNGQTEIWQPSAGHVTLSDYNQTIKITNDATERWVFLKEKDDAGAWTPARKVLLRASQSRHVLCTYKTVALANWTGTALAVAAPAGAVVGGTSATMHLTMPAVTGTSRAAVCNQGSITDATNATPVVITTAAAHGLSTGNRVNVRSVGGNTAANGNWTITVLSATTFSLDTSVGSGAYTSGGTWTNITQFNSAVAAVAAGDEIVISSNSYPVRVVADGTISQTSFAANHGVNGKQGFEGVLVRGATGTAADVELVVLWEVYTLRTSADDFTLFGLKDLTLDNTGTDTTFFLQGGYYNVENVLFKGVSSSGARDLASASVARNYLTRGTFLWCDASDSAQDCWNFSGAGGGTVTGATNATPIVITTGASHGMNTGDVVRVYGVLGNTAANGSWTVTNLTATTFSLQGSAGNGAYTSGGLWTNNYNDNSFIRLLGCSGARPYNAGDGQVITSHLGLPVLVCGGTFSDAHTNVIASDNDAAAVRLFFATLSKGARNCGVVNATLMGCDLTQQGNAYTPLVNGYEYFCDHKSTGAAGASLLRVASTTPAGAVLAHNRLDGQSLGGRGWFASVGYDLKFNLFRRFAEALRYNGYSSGSTGPASFVGNTFDANTTAILLDDATLTWALRNQACKGSTTSFSGTAGSMALGSSDYGVYDPTVDADFVAGANDTTGADAALDANWLPTAAGNCDDNGDTSAVDYVGGSDFEGFVLVTNPTKVPRGCRRRPRGYESGDLVYEDIW